MLGAPLVAAKVLLSRTGRRVVVGTLTFAIAAIAVFVMALLTVLALLSPASGSEPPTVPAPDAPVTGDWIAPAAGSYTVTSLFGPRDNSACPYCSSDHQGVDLVQGCGAGIVAAGAGTVIVAGNYGGYGNSILIDHGDGHITLYGHMGWGSVVVSVGERVNPGDALGAEGQTGNSQGCHLHFEVRTDGLAIDPIPFMSKRGVDL